MVREVDTLLSEKSSALKALCAKYDVAELKLFGSATGTDFDLNKSDLDFLVNFGIPPKGMRLSTQFFGFLDELELLFGRPIDLLEESAIENTHLRKSVNSSAVSIYVA